MPRINRKPPLDDYAMPTDERMKRAGDDWEEVNTDPDGHAKYQTIRMLDRPIDRLASTERKKPGRGLTGVQYHALLRIFEDFYNSRLEESGVVNPAKDRVDCANHGELSEFVLAARNRFEKAIKALTVEEANIVDDVVIRETPIHVYADRFRQYPRYRDRMLKTITRLQGAADRLDYFYYGRRG